MEITFESLYERCVALSSYEAGKSVADPSLYSLLLITSRDKAALLPMLNSGLSMLGAMIGEAFESFDYADGIFTITFATDTHIRANVKRVQKPLTEALVCIVMSRWLDNKIPERAASYKTMASEMAMALVKNIYKKSKPTLPK